MSSGFSAAEGAAYDGWKTSGPDDGGPDCPECGAEGAGQPSRDDEGRRCVDPCEECAARCKNCGQVGPKGEDGKYCLDCDGIKRLCECGATLDEGTEDFSFCRKCD